jgi:3',5'-nucleoside bisphosphate phosphatase
MDLDLHLHSTASDGTLLPAQVVAAALAARLDVISLTDHDTTAGVSAALAAAAGHSLEVIPGIEVSATWELGEIHVLGYLIDPAHPRILEHGEWAGDRRTRRMQTMVARLQGLGVGVEMAHVEAAAGEERGSLARPHLARALMAVGAVGSTYEAFDRYIGDDQPAYEPTRLLGPEAAVEMIRAAGGIAVWAHPPMDQLDALLPRLVRAGLRGLETYRPRNSRDWTRRLEDRARSHELLVTGGSDWHGPESGPLGGFRVSSRDIPGFLEVAGM